MSSCINAIWVRIASIRVPSCTLVVITVVTRLTLLVSAQKMRWIQLPCQRLWCKSVPLLKLYHGVTVALIVSNPCVVAASGYVCRTVAQNCQSWVTETNLAARVVWWHEHVNAPSAACQ